MSQTAIKNMKGYALMFVVFMLVFSTIVPIVAKGAVENISAVPVMLERMDTFEAGQKQVLSNQVEIMTHNAVCTADAVRCREDIKDLQERIK